MQTAHFYKKKINKRGQFPLSHIALASAISIFTFIGVFATPAETVGNSDTALLTTPIALNFKQAAQTIEPIEQLRLQNLSDLPDEPNWEAITIRKGDRLASIFQQARIPESEYNKLIRAADNTFNHLKDGQRLIFQFGEERQLKTLRYTKTPLESYTFTRTDNSFNKSAQIRKPQIRYTNHSITLVGSLGNSLKRSGLNSIELANQITSALRGQINISAHAKKGDQLHVLVEEEFIDSKKLGFGNLLAAQYEGNKEYTAFRYEDSNGRIRYYSPNVSQRYKTVKKAVGTSFLRSPVPGARISSHFSSNRLHPILKTRRPHNGTDFAARTGTPILATESGRVVKASYNRANGNYVIIDHGSRFTTKYLHMHRRYVKAGDRVNKGQKIGSVGATGLANGAHLHYEFHVNGAPKNPLRISKYAPSKYANVKVAIDTPAAIPDRERKRFFEQTRGVRLQFAAAVRKSEDRIVSRTPHDQEQQHLNDQAGIQSEQKDSSSSIDLAQLSDPSKQRL